MSESSDLMSKNTRARIVSVIGLGVVGIALIILGSVTSWQRTLIPGSFDGEVQNIVTYEVDQPGVDDWVSLSIGGHETTTGNDALVCMEEGSIITKAPFSRHVFVDGQQCELPFPRQALTDSVVPLLLVGVLVLFGVPLGTRRNSEPQLDDES